MIKLKNNILTDKEGTPLKPKSLPIIELQYDTAYFPPIIQNEWRVVSSIPNKMYIDLGEDVPVWESNSVTSVTVPIIHTFPNATRRTAKVWFQHPSAVRGFYSTRVAFTGLFPKELLLFNISNLTLHSTRFDSFPTVLKGGIFNTMTLQGIAVTTINNIPDWITQSKVTTLKLYGGFDLSDPLVNNMDKLVNTKGLTTLGITATFSPTSFPDNFKDISTLRVLGFASSNIKAIPQQVTDCKQLTNLHCGYTDGNVSGNGNFNSWGTGIGGMNLKVIAFRSCTSMPDSLPTGIETCPSLKSIDTNSSYKTQTRIDNVIVDAYNKVNTFASKAVGNTLLRQITWGNAIAASTFGYNVRPTGTYQQPAGFILGSNNGLPSSPMEMVWVLVNQYKWKITLTNSSGNGTETYQ